MVAKVYSAISRETGNRFLDQLEEYGVTGEDLRTLLEPGSWKTIQHIAQEIGSVAAALKAHPYSYPYQQDSGYCR